VLTRRRLYQFAILCKPIGIHVRAIMPPISERAIAFAGMEL